MSNDPTGLNDPCTACGFSPTVAVKEICDLWLPVDAISQNTLKGNGKGSGGYAYRNYRNKCLHQLENALKETYVPVATKKRRVKFTRWYRPGQRPYDNDNLVAGFKPLRDCLRLTGIIKDDSPKWLETQYHQEMEEHGGVSVFVEEFV